MFSIVKSAEERLQHSVDDFRKQTWLEWLSLLHSDLAESELGCVQFHTCHFIGRNVAVLSLCQTYNDAKEHKIIIFSLSFKNVPASVADEKHCDANCILLLAILGIERIVLMDLGSGSFFCFSKCVQGKSDGKNTLLHVTWKRKIVTESRLAICQIRDNFAEKESRNPKDDTESKTSGFSKKKIV